MVVGSPSARAGARTGRTEACRARRCAALRERPGPLGSGAGRWRCRPGPRRDRSAATRPADHRRIPGSTVPGRARSSGGASHRPPRSGPARPHASSNAGGSTGIHSRSLSPAGRRVLDLELVAGPERTAAGRQPVTCRSIQQPSKPFSDSNVD